MSCNCRSFGKLKIKDSIKLKKRKLKKKLRKSKRKFGVGYKGDTSYPQNYYQNYFGEKVPFILPSEYWAPITNKMPQLPPLYKF